jgi:single-strand DNA-binding protein
MPTGAAAAQAGTKARPKPDRDDRDRGPGSLAGNLTADPDLKFTDSGRAVSNLRVACSERVKDDKTGEWTDSETSYYSVVVWGNLAENVAENLAKGDRIVAEGRWTSRTWKDDQGDEHEAIDLTARDLGPSMIFNGARPARKERQAKKP